MRQSTVLVKKSFVNSNPASCKPQSWIMKEEYINCLLELVDVWKKTCIKTPCILRLRQQLFNWHSSCHLQQTNTADMLEEAVEYVKFLQNQIQVLPALN